MRRDDAPLELHRPRSKRGRLTSGVAAGPTHCGTKQFAIAAALKTGANGGEMLPTSGRKTALVRMFWAWYPTHCGKNHAIQRHQLDSPRSPAAYSVGRHSGVILVEGTDDDVIPESQKILDESQNVRWFD